MKRVPIFPCIVGLHAALAAAALLWALQARFGDPLTAAYILLTIVRPGGALFEAAMGIPF